MWYTGDTVRLTPEMVTEHVLGCEDWDDFQGLLWALGIKETAKIFRRQIRRKNCPYDVKIKHYFRLYFNKYAPLRRQAVVG